MKRQIIGIGGGGFGRNPGEGIIENYILEQSDVNKPKVCFIPTATGDDEGYKESYYSTFSMFDCDPVHLDFFKREGMVHMSNLWQPKFQYFCDRFVSNSAFE